MVLSGGCCLLPDGSPAESAAGCGGPVSGTAVPGGGGGCQQHRRLYFLVCPASQNPGLPAGRCRPGGVRRRDPGGAGQQAGLSRHHWCQCRGRSGGNGVLRPGPAVRLGPCPVCLRRRYGFRAAGGVGGPENRCLPNHRDSGGCGCQRPAQCPVGGPYHLSAGCGRSQRRFSGGRFFLRGACPAASGWHPHLSWPCSDFHLPQ